MSSQQLEAKEGSRELVDDGKEDGNVRSVIRMVMRLGVKAANDVTAVGLR